jgi:hypothetical protein
MKRKRHIQETIHETAIKYLSLERLSMVRNFRFGLHSKHIIIVIITVLNKEFGAVIT